MLCTSTTPRLLHSPRRTDDLTVKDVGIESDSEGQCIGVQKGNEDFVAYLNEKIAEMQEQGLIDQYVAEAQTLAGIE